MRLAALAALAVATASALLPSTADAAVGEVRATGDYRLSGTANDFKSRGKTGPNLAVNPANSNHIVEIHEEVETEQCEFNRSLDEGVTWSGGVLRAPAGYPVASPGPCDVSGGNIGQHSLEFGSGNNVYAVWTASRTPGAIGFTVLLSKSTDGGATFPPAIEVPGMVGGAAPAASFSRPEIVVDRRSGSTDHLIIAARDSRTSKAIVSRSEDAGGTWGSPVEASKNNPLTNPPPVWNANNTAVATAGDAFIAARELTQPALGPARSGGYRVVSAGGAVFSFGNAGNFGDLNGIALDQPIVGSATTPSGNGYWMVASDGGIFAFGDARFFGSTGGIRLDQPIVGMAPTPSGNGYWMVASDGGIFSFGDARFFGSTGGIRLDQPVVGMAPTPSGNGYWMVASDGGIFSFGDAKFFGSTGGIPLDKPVVGMSSTPSGNGYFLVASDGGIFAYGDAVFTGSTGGIPLNQPVIGLTTSPSGRGYNLVASDGGIFSFGDAGFFGSTGGSALASPIVASASSNKMAGPRAIYLGWLATRNTGVCPPNCEQLGESTTDSYIVMGKSLDNGVTWTRSRAINVRGFISPAGTLHTGSHFPRLATGPGGEVYLTFNQGPGVLGSNNCGSGPFPAGSPGAAGTTGCPSYGSASFKAADHFINWDLDVMFMRSTDQGATWTDLKQLNEPKKPGLAVAEVTQTRHPEMIVATDGRIHLAWEDRRHWYINTSDRKAAFTPNGPSLGNYACVHSHSNCPEARLGDTYYTQSSDAGLTFAQNRRINDRSHNNDIGLDYRFSAYWSYGPALAHLGNERLIVADMDPRLGNPDTDSLDIFLRKVDLRAPTGAIPTENMVSGGPADFSVRLSQRVQPGGGEAVHGEASTSRPWTRPVIVNEVDMPAALAGGVLARANVGPLLASTPTGLPNNVKSEVSRMSPVGAYIVGDATKLSTQVETDLIAAGVPAPQLVRISGGTPADIAAQIALTLDRRRPADKTTSPPLPAFDAVIIANPDSASAASASALAANRRLPILYVNQNSVPQATTNAMTSLAVTKAIIVGSTGVISVGVASGLGLTAANITRLSGGDQFGTSNAVVTESLARGLPKNIVYVADGNKPMHAALLGAAVGRMGGLLILAKDGSAANAEAALTTTAPSLRPHIDRLLTSTLSGVPVVGNDPA